MASIEFINKRISGKEKELDKLTKKLKRIEKAQASDWTDNPYYYNESDIRFTQRDIQEAQESLDKYKQQLNEETTKANSRNIPAILNFLEIWKSRNFEFYEKAIKEYFLSRENLKSLQQKQSNYSYGTDEYKKCEIEYRAAQEIHYQKSHGYFRPLTENEKEQKKYRYTSSIKTADGEWEYANQFLLCQSYDESIEKLQKALELEAQRKYDFIVERTVFLIGTITDATNLKVGAKDDLNGFIIGENGTAKVQTIGAGGYNIQMFHFRTLINKC